MIPALARFVEALRREGVSASPAEVLDAAHGVEAVGMEERTRFRGALRATLAKRRQQQMVFDRVFDLFFVPPPRGAGFERAEGEGVSHGESKGRQRSTDVPPRSRPMIRPRESCRRGRSEAKAIERGRSEEKSEEARRRAVDREGVSTRVLLSRRIQSRDMTSADRPRTLNLAAPMTTEEERELARKIPYLIDTLRLKAGRRAIRAARGRVWTRRIFRESLRHGGVPFVLPLRSKKPRRAKVVLLVDVSYSVARAAGFFLWMAGAFLALGRETRVLLFVDRPVDATAPLARWLARSGGARGIARGATVATKPSGGPAGLRGRRPGEGIAPAGESFADLLTGLRDLNLEAPSDYGRAFHALLNSHLRPGGRDTILVILGDGRTNRFEPLSWSLDEIARRCRALLWLVPEPFSRWGTGDSALPVYLRHADLAVEASDLEGISRGVSELVRHL